MLWYLSHPEVRIDPDVPVPDWVLSDRGRARTLALAAAGWPAAVVRILTSPERKARETADILAQGRRVTVVADTGEIDRSATGFVPHDRHEALADALFAHPDRSAEGWETARDAQARVCAALEPHLAMDGDLLVIGHGGVGTLLWCTLTGRVISRVEDQPGGGHVWALRPNARAWEIVHPWLSFEALVAPATAASRA